MPQLNSTDALLERIVSLTDKGQITWRLVWDDKGPAADLDDLVRTTAPVAFLADDDTVGRVLLRLDDPQNEGGPVLYVNGDAALDADPVDLTVLEDTVRVYLRDLQLGRAKTPADRLQEAFQKQMERVRTEGEAKDLAVGQLLAQVAKQTDVISQALTLAQGIQVQALTAGPLADDEGPLLLTPQTLRAVVSVCRDNWGDVLEVDTETLQEAIDAVNELF
jgi:hypothetical protein